MVAERRFDGAVRVDLINRWQAEASSEWCRTSYCDEEASKTTHEKEDLKAKTELQMAEARRTEAQGQLTTDTEDLKRMEDALAEDTAALEDHNASLPGQGCGV